MRTSQNLEHRLRLVGLLHYYRELGEADKHIQSLEESHPRNFLVTLSRAKWRQLKGDSPGEILSTVDGFVDKKHAGGANGKRSP